MTVQALKDKGGVCGFETPEQDQAVRPPRTGPQSRETSLTAAMPGSASRRICTTIQTAPRPKKNDAPPAQRTITGAPPCAKTPQAGKQSKPSAPRRDRRTKTPTPSPTPTPREPFP